MAEQLYPDGILQPPRPEDNRFLQDLDRDYNARWFHLLALFVSVVQIGAMLVGHAHMVHGSHGWLSLFPLSSDFVFGCTVWYVALVLIAKMVVTSLAIRRLFRWPATVHPLHADGIGGMHDVARVYSIMALTGLTASSVSALFLLAGHVSVMAWLCPSSRCPSYGFCKERTSPCGTRSEPCCRRSRSARVLSLRPCGPAP